MNRNIKSFKSVEPYNTKNNVSAVELQNDVLKQIIQK